MALSACGTCAPHSRCKCTTPSMPTAANPALSTALPSTRQTYMLRLTSVSTLCPSRVLTIKRIAGRRWRSLVGVGGDQSYWPRLTFIIMDFKQKTPHQKSKENCIFTVCSVVSGKKGKKQKKSIPFGVHLGVVCSEKIKKLKKGHQSIVHVILSPSMFDIRVFPWFWATFGTFC
jgi:hypothetical protein